MADAISDPVIIAAPLAAPTVAVFGQATAPATPAADATVLPEFQVSTTKQIDDYIAAEAISGTRTGAKILELPYDVEVLTKEFIDDFRLYEQDDMLKFTANFTPRDPDSGTGGGNRLRGFEPLQMRDGLSRASPADLTNIAQVEVIKGPQSTLYGQTEPGGIVNYITKKPKERPATGSRSPPAATICSASRWRPPARSSEKSSSTFSPPAIARTRPTSSTTTAGAKSTPPPSPTSSPPPPPSAATGSNRAPPPTAAPAPSASSSAAVRAAPIPSSAPAESSAAFTCP